jgi:hypothetical protein
MNRPISQLVQRRVRVPFSDTDAPIRPSCEVGERWTVNLDIADQVLPDMAAHAIDHALRGLAYDIHGRVLSSVYKVLDDHVWARSVVEDEIRGVARRYAESIFAKDDKQ